MTTPVIPVSWGEFLDKQSILAIKRHRIRRRAALANVRHEAERLRAAVVPPSGVAELEAALLAVNTRLWRVEDLIRLKEATGDFGTNFVALARAVYRENDERGRIKQAINERLRSELVEEKQYSSYESGVPSGETAGAPKSGL